MNPRRSVLLALIAGGLLFSGCSDCTGSLQGTGLDVGGDTGGGIDTSPAADADQQDDAGDDLSLCPPANRCQTTCCGDEELCLGGQCLLPGDDCQHSNQCDDGEYCEPTVGKCFPEVALACTFVPDGDVFDPVIETAWEAGPDTPMSAHNQVMMAPSVVDITGDGIPEIVFSTFTGHLYNENSVLRAVNGRTYEPIFDLTDPAARVSGASSIAIGDIDGDGRNEIVAVRSGGQGLIAFDDHSTGWAIKWTTENFNMSWDGAYLVDLDANGAVEIVAANRVFDGATGQELCVNTAVGATPRNSIVADLTGDGNQEIIAFNGAFRFIREPDGTVSCPTLWTYEGGPGGFPAAADFGTFSGAAHHFGDFNGLPEVAIITNDPTQIVKLHNGQTGELIWSATISPGGHPHYDVTQCSTANGSGAPTIADFNGDGRPNVATAGACFYAVFNDEGDEMWRMPTQDLSSRVTGSSVFDFQGDGRAEVVYADECFLRVYDGAGNGDGTTDILFQVANTTGTTRELPVIVDVDADFHADIVLIGNDYSGGITNGCRAQWPGFDELGGPSRGIRVIRDRENQWVSTRPVWNQHAYSVTNICDGVDDSLCPGQVNRPGAIPRGRVDNWNAGYLNNYRQNVQGEGLFLAPDLTITDISTFCTEDYTRIQVTVTNQGSRAVIPGLNVALFTVEAGVETLLTVLQTTALLAPGASETLEYIWQESPLRFDTMDHIDLIGRANDDGEGNRQFRECNEDNNERSWRALCQCLTNDDCPFNHYCADSGVCLVNPG